MSSFNAKTSSNMQSYYNSVGRFKGMSWIDIVIMVEEEQEIARAAAIRKSIAVRNALIAKGEYELEEGEEIENDE